MTFNQMKEERSIKVLDKGEVALIDYMGDDEAICQAARISYSSNKKQKNASDKDLIRYLMRHNHTSVFEMCVCKFYLKMPIFVHNQVVRHRTASQNVMSLRYSEALNEFYVPKEEHVTEQNPTNKQGAGVELVKYESSPYPYNILNSWEQDFEFEQNELRDWYEAKLKSGMRRELARINLPLSQYTELYWKMDLKNLFHFLKLLLDQHSQMEIRVYAEAIYELIKPIFPIACEAFNDYILNSIQLTTLEQKVLRGLISDGVSLNSTELDVDDFNSGIDRISKEFISNKRERNECVEKIKKLIGVK